ncbi:hypothetical protein V7112_06350 [Bacillus sp. JJ1566]|uniref:DUF7226 domain-containing protein n=1 Tax=Bacillus sp. JJ1566 TaxID=3122961 RepID=UPI002FFF157E
MTDRIKMVDILQIATNTCPNIENIDTPFPQADSYDILNSLLNLLNTRNMKKKEIVSKMSVVDRQVDYYLNFGMYLGLIKRKEIAGITHFSLTTETKEIFNQSNDNIKKLFIVEKIFKHNIFKRSFLESIENCMISRDFIVELMIQENIDQLFGLKSDSTLYRRARTIESWIEWIKSLYR